MMGRLRRRVAEVLQVRQKGGRLSLLVDVLLIILISLSTLSIILESVDSFGRYFREELYWFEVLSVIVFTVEYLARVWSSPDNDNAGEGSDWKIRLRYLFTPMAIIDLLAILPFYLVFFVSVDLRFLRVVRLIRVFKLTRYSSAMRVLLAVLREEASSFAAAAFVLGVLLVLASSGIYLIEQEVQPEAFGSIPAAMWWAMATLTTVGYGDVTPITPLGKFFGGCITIIGMGMVALPAGILASGFSENIHRMREEYGEQIDEALDDGELSDREQRQLEELREELGLPQEAADMMIRAAMHRLSTTVKNCPHCHKPLHEAGPARPLVRPFV
jgi:voltage-gated potassium channel